MRIINLNRHFVQFTIEEDKYLEHLHRRYKDIKNNLQTKMITGGDGYPKNRTGTLSASIRTHRNDNEAGIETGVEYAKYVEARKKFFDEEYELVSQKKRDFNLLHIKVR